MKNLLTPSVRRPISSVGFPFAPSSGLSSVASCAVSGYSAESSSLQTLYTVWWQHTHNRRIIRLAWNR